MITKTSLNARPSDPVKYTSEQINAIDAGLSGNIFRNSSNNLQDNSINTEDYRMNYNHSEAKNIVIESDVENASNIAIGSLNKAE
ncbi:MAG: hypothetical protein U9N59_06040 [Campylobacterota bacterium]|nr:hypothetical protein [Campylobacterota bacterium]